MTSIQKQLENEMVSEIKSLGYSEIRIDEFNRSGELSSSKVYSKLIYAVRRMINFAQGGFPIYQGAEVTNMGYKMKISMN